MAAVNDLQTRPARTEEAPLVAALVNAAFRVEAFFKRGDRTSGDEIRDLMTRGQFLVLDEPADRDNRHAVAGCVYVERSGDRAYFGMLAVDPRHQGRGFGRRLVEAVESLCRAEGRREIEIHIVNLRRELPAFYRALGYVERGTLPFPEGDHGLTQPCHFIVMTKPLEPVRPA